MTLQVIMTDKALLQTMQIDSFDLNRRSEEMKLENKRLEGVFNISLFPIFTFLQPFSVVVIDFSFSKFFHYFLLSFFIVQVFFSFIKTISLFFTTIFNYQIVLDN